jgi:hypothetical protein
MNYMDYKKINELLIKIVNKEFKEGNRKLTDKIKKHPYFIYLKEFLDEYYVKEGYGIKSLIKKYELSITYTSFKNIIVFLGYELHSNKIATEALKKQRSENAKKQYINKTGFFKDGIQENIHKMNTNRGIQGYYWNDSLKKYVWLRSSWEFIYAKWLNKNNIIWDVEIVSYRLSDGTIYRPDFFIFNENNEIKKVVEIKGYWKNRLYKTFLLKEEYNVDIITIENIKPYCDNKLTLNEEINIWKSLRKLKLNK